MRFPRMTIRRWMIVVAVAAIDCAAISRRGSAPLATVALIGTFAAVILAAPFLLLLSMALDD